MRQMKISENESNSSHVKLTQPETIDFYTQIPDSYKKFQQSVSKDDKFKRIANYKQGLNKKLKVVQTKMLQRVAQIENNLRKKFHKEKSRHQSDENHLQDLFEQNRQVYERAKVESKIDPLWRSLNCERIKLEAVIDSCEHSFFVNDQVMPYDQVSNNVADLIDRSLISQQLKLDQHEMEVSMQNHKLEKNQQIASISLKKKIKDQGLLHVDSISKSKPVTMDMINEDNNQSCSVDFYIQSVIDQQQKAFGYISRQKKREKNLQREQKVYDYLNETSWQLAYQKQKQIATADLKHRERCHKILKSREKSPDVEKKNQTFSSGFQSQKSKLFRTLSTSYNVQRGISEKFERPQLINQYQDRIRDSVYENRNSPPQLTSKETKGFPNKYDCKSTNDSQLFDQFASTSQISNWQTLPHNSSTISSNAHQQTCQDIIHSLSYIEPESFNEIDSETDVNSARKVQQQSKRLTKEEEAQMQRKLTKSGISNVQQDYSNTIKNLHKIKELNYISRTVNRYIQPHDPFIIHKFEQFRQLTKNAEKESGAFSKMGRKSVNCKPMLKNSPQAITKFLIRRGLAKDHLENPNRKLCLLSQNAIIHGNSSSQNVGIGTVLDKIHFKSFQQGVFSKSNITIGDQKQIKIPKKINMSHPSTQSEIDQD